MLDEAPSIQRQKVVRPAAAQVDALRGTPTGFLVDALGGSGALDYRIKPAIAEQDGVVVVPQARLDDVIARLPAIREAEAGMDRAVRDGLRVPAFLRKG